MSDLLDTTPSRKRTGSAKKVSKPADSRTRPGRVPAKRTVKIRESIVEALKGKRNGVPNVTIAADLKISAGECLKLAQLLIKEGKVVSFKNDANQVVLKRS